MSERKPFLQPEDYLEPVCPFCDQTHPKVRQIPIDRVLAKLDEYIEKKDVDAADRHLAYWLEEADAGRDEGGKLTLLNERMGLMRNAGRHPEAVKYAKEALALLEKAGFAEDTVAGTTYLNAATVCNAAGNAQEALPLYEKAEEIYKKDLSPDDVRFGGLYNNMAVTCMHLGQFGRAEECSQKALVVMKNAGKESLECAVTYVNMATLYETEFGAEEGEKKINECLDAAQALLDGRHEEDPFAAFVYEKCAPAFDYFGRFFYAQELSERAKKIYERA